MRRKYFFFTFLAATMLLLGNLTVSAQIAPLVGEVTMQQADGTKVPAAGAQIDVFRTDIASKYNTKTDKKGKFSFAGIPALGTYVIAASAPNARPDVIGGVKVGQDVIYKLTLLPGDGKRLTEAEAKAMTGGGTPSSGGAAPAESAEDRKKREEMLRENAKVEEGNKKIEETNATVTRTFKAGNDALNAKKYDEAIALYTEGINADPTHPGAPVLLTNKSIALRARGVDRYNAAVTATDDAVKTSGLEAAKKDFRDAVEASTKAVEALKALPVPTDPAAQTNHNTNKYLALAARAEAMRLLVIKADPSQADAGLVAFQEYMAVETAPDKKAKAQVDAAQMLLDAGVSDKAYTEFQKILAENPENIDAMLGAGLALFQSGDKAKFQEAANYLQHFVDKAPETHRLRASAKDALDYLKSAENVKPQKTTTTGGRRRG
ncbi:MAG: Carboxypeptidase regulatory-like domain [Acidobacteriota bacterium]|jgi:tetratricopeptide (TPR) repeat protein|nr:Carboxypeptidase regulatory-like domain [Acidobacteriota bacterium]